MQARADLISEPLTPHTGTFDTSSMGRGVPGLPAGFDWRGESFQIVETIATWKHSSAEGARAGGETYLRRHYFRLRMSDASVWTVYFVRQPPRSGNAKNRWFLYTMEASRRRDD